MTGDWPCGQLEAAGHLLWEPLGCFQSPWGPGPPSILPGSEPGFSLPAGPELFSITQRWPLRVSFRARLPGQPLSASVFLCWARLLQSSRFNV